MKLVPAGNGWMHPQDPGEPGRNMPRWSVSDKEARIASEIFRGLDVLEIGTGLGVSTREIAKRARRVHTVDIDPWVREIIAPTLPGNVTFYNNLEAVPQVDAAFIDGLHTYAQVSDDIRLACEKGCTLIVFHDMSIPDVEQAVRDSGLEYAWIWTAVGMAMAWTR